MLEYHKMHISLVVDSSAQQEAALASCWCYHISSRGYKHQWHRPDEAWPPGKLTAFLQREDPLGVLQSCGCAKSAFYTRDTRNPNFGG